MTDRIDTAAWREEEIMSLEGIANTLRGMTFDLRIPNEVREILAEKSAEIDAITEAHLEDQA